MTSTDGKDSFGLESVKHVLKGNSWEISGIFPRVSMCDFKVTSLL